MFNKKNKTKTKKSNKLKGLKGKTFHYGMLPTIIADASDLLSALPLKEGGKISSKKKTVKAKLKCSHNRLY